MTLRTLALAFAVFSVIGTAPIAQTSVLSVEQVRPGMVGIGRTVFEGNAVEEFQVHVLGVLRNVVAPRRNLILARLEGGPLARTGVIAGMSGSPVYIDGKLLGAVSYSIGQFSKEPIAGITPIGEMVDATAMAPIAPGTRPVDIAWPAQPKELIDIWRRDLGIAQPFARDQADALLVGGDANGLTSRVGTLLRPITVPLAMAGLESQVLDPLLPALTDRGFQPVSSSTAQTIESPRSARPLAPGDAVGVSLLSGDFQLGATGTVTYVDGDRVYAFGHPMYNLGPTEFPMTRADVHVVLPSLLQSLKLASLGDVIGTVQQDRATAIAGRLGSGPKLIPVNITLNSPRAATRTFNFTVVRDHTFTPLLTYLAVANVLTSYERAVGPATYTVRGTATIRAHGEISFEDIFTGDQPVGGAAAYVAGPLTQLLRNGSEAVEFEGMKLTIDATEQAQTARIERVWLNTARPRPGQDVEVRVLLRTFKGEEIVKTMPITLPANASGSMQLLVADASRLSQEDRNARRGAETQRVSQLIRTFNRARRNNRLYIRLSAPDAGAVVNGEAMTALPPSVLAVLEADRNSGSFGALRTATRGEWELPVELAVSGSRQLTLALDQP
jgi:SpoIVB peptidase S55